MRYIVYVSTYVYNDIDSGNLKGEGRWERNVLDALVRDGRDVYVVPWNNREEWKPEDQPRIWCSEKPCSPNLKDYYQLDQTDMSDTLFLGHSPSGALDIPVKARRYIIQWFNGPDGNVADDFLKLVHDNPNSVVGTYNFPVASSKLRIGLHTENLANIHGPAFPFIQETDNFNSEYLLWMSKKLWAYSTEERMKPILREIFSWCADKIKASNLKLAFLLGSAGPYKTIEEVTDWFWTNDFSIPLKEIKDKVNFLYSVEWNKIHTILRQTKLIIHPWPGFGGAPYELSAYGIPHILFQTGHPFQNQNHQSLFPEVITVQDDYDKSFLSKLNRLYSDRNFYTSTGNAYRNFVKENGSYSAYLKQLDNLCKERGWM